MTKNLQYFPELGFQFGAYYSTGSLVRFRSVRNFAGPVLTCAYTLPLAY
jgi:hypothetical protein